MMAEQKKEKIVEILLNELSYAYCDNCGTTDCADCHRKDQNWRLGRNAAEGAEDHVCGA